ncbi:MAG: hypothetical protein Q4C04_06660 [Clostridia bacterium]|nr:hypothetical protein [Clostridia bacterium]
MKKWLKTLIIILICLALLGGGIFAYAHFSGKTPVEVQPAGNWMLSYMPYQSYLYGTVSSDTAQTIYHDGERTVLEVFVAQGDAVSIGDPLLRYDATLDAITLDEKKLEREKLYNELLDDYIEYKRYARQDFESSLATPSPSASSQTSGVSAQTAPRHARLSLRGLADLSLPTGGDGTVANPYTYSISDSEPVSASFLADMKELAIERAATVFARLVIDSQRKIELYVKPDGLLSFSVLMPETTAKTPNFQTPISGDGSQESPLVFDFAANTYVPEGFFTVHSQAAQQKLEPVYVSLSANAFTASISFSPDGSCAFFVKAASPSPTPFSSPTPSPSPTPTPEPTETLDPSSSPTPEIGGGGGMSRAEREEYARQVAAKIREKELRYRQLSHDILKLELNGMDGIVYSSIDGVVTNAKDPAGLSTGDVVLEVRGGSGCHISCVIGESELSQYPEGTILEGFSYDSGTEVTAQVLEVGTMPISTNYSTNGSPNSSGYMIVLEVLDDLTLNIGEYIEFSSFEPLSEQGMIFLNSAFIREIDGRDCIFVVRDGVLRQETVTTGKRVDSYVELIDCNLTSEDYIAFPYDKHCRDGAPYELAENEPYYYMY